ncbi:hypothetical protein C4577_07425 [Candidatus Parcubacteria bacterium]|nr:MAG: hypothetical protein C4577_07425 [Candidatus Parcubacteria bacterium]
MERTECNLETYMRFLMETINPNNEFTPSVYWNKNGDQIEVWWKRDSYYAENFYGKEYPLGAKYISQETGEVIGVCIYGIENLLFKDNMLSREPERQMMDAKFAEWAAKQENVNETS